MNRYLLVTFFFITACSQPQSRVFPEDTFSKLESDQVLPISNIANEQKAISVFSRLTLSRLIAKHVVNLSTLYMPPENIRVDIFSSGLPKLLFLVSRSEDSVQLVSPDEHTVYLGDTSSRPLEKIMGFPLSELSLLNLLLGKSSLPVETQIIEHSQFLIYRLEYKGESNFRYRLYFKKIDCDSSVDTDKYKFSGLEVLSEDEQYLFFAKVKFSEPNKICSEVYPSQIEFENFNNRFSGLIDKIQVKSDLIFDQQEQLRIFSPTFPGYLVKPLVRSHFQE